jgi:2-phosphosulfolactate phosphatase
MKVNILEFVEGARIAKGVAVIIDVFRAFSVACYVFDAGASKLIVTAGVDAAFQLKSRYANSVLVGERDEKKVAGFDFGNSPTDIIKSDLKGKIVIQTTTAGTYGLINAVKADVVITGSLVNAGAVIKYLQAMDPDHVSLVAMGYRGEVSADEDLLCAEMITAGLSGKGKDWSEQISGLKNSSGSRFFNPDNIDFSPPTDFFLCTMHNRFSFILQANRRYDGNIDLLKVDI